MSPTAIVLLIGICLSAFFLVFALLGMSGGGKGLNSSLGGIVASQRQRSAAMSAASGETTPFDLLPRTKVSDSALTLKKRLKYAQWGISPAAFRLCEIGLSLGAFLLAGLKLNILLQALALLTGPIVMRWLLGFFMDRRFKSFDQDYSPFILQLVSLLKTGMNVMGALETAAQGLEDNSLVREEVELMMERLRFGVSEDKSIGSFGEDIYHPEIELFVQALLLSRRVGGTLSDTLERLSRQVRRRQYFRKAAHASISMQRGSIWFILFIMGFLELYLYIVYPEAVVGAWKSEIGFQVWQTGIFLIIMGIFWVRQVTKIKV
ncbi:MAG: type II secretion system F family protein [Deltaproteobacteria bacterium]|nr:type II secretion system F family protein [Deltaproteobacteria bacterium]